MTQLVLTRPHTHAGKKYGVGDRIEIDAKSADWTCPQMTDILSD